IEYWTGADQVAAVWVTARTAGVVSRELRPEQIATLQQPGGPASGATLLAGIPLDSSVTDLLIAPDGPLYAVPFEALTESPGGRLLIEQYTVSYLPSAALLLRSSEHRKPALPWKAQLVGFGDPIVNASAAPALD